MLNFMLHSLQPSHGAVNFILAQLYVGVYIFVLSKQALCPKSDTGGEVHFHARNERVQFQKERRFRLRHQYQLWGKLFYNVE